MYSLYEEHHYIKAKQRFVCLFWFLFSKLHGEILLNLVLDVGTTNCRANVISLHMDPNEVIFAKQNKPQHTQAQLLKWKCHWTRIYKLTMLYIEFGKASFKYWHWMQFSNFSDWDNATLYILSNERFMNRTLLFFNGSSVCQYA